jgi:hypothetical protein
MDQVYEYAGAGPMPLLLYLRVKAHLLLCPDCAAEYERFEVTRSVLREDFLPRSPGLEEALMAKIALEPGMDEEIFPGEEDLDGDVFDRAFTADDPGGLSTRGWVIAGVLRFLSLGTAFLGLSFRYIVFKAGMSFIIPLGITVGMVLSVYGALFIGSHLKELTERFLG